VAVRPRSRPAALGRWTVPAAGVRWRVGRGRLIAWGAAGCAAWAAVLTAAFELLLAVLG